jgi:ankyrin repeat protein/GTPase SAR1 family protein
LQIKNKEGVTPLSMWMWDQTVILHSLCEENYLPDMTRKFLQAGANPNVEDGNGFTPLMKVITSNLTDSTANAIVTILCEFNCDVNLKRHKFSPAKKNAQIWEGTALHMAAKLGSKPLCVQTLTAQCTTAVGIRDDLGRIPLHIAAINGHHSLMQYLRLPHDHEYLCTKDIFGCTPLYYACKGGNYPCIKYMFKYIPNDSIQRYVEIANNTGTTPLTVADTNGRTALHHALHEGDVKLACKLLRVGADLAVKDHLGCTPLTIRSESDSTRNRTFLHHLCTGEGTFDLIVELLKAGADPNVKDNDGYTPFMLALKYIDDSSAFRILTALRDFQHDLSITTSLSRTALHIATENNKAKCVELLIAQGADLLAKTLYGKIPLHIACIKGHANLLSHFLTEMCIASADATGSTPLHYACEYGHIECVKKIVLMENDSLNLQFQVTKLNLDGATPLTVTNNQGRTILHQACVALELPLVQKILKYGACPNAKDYAGFTPLMLTLQAEKFSEILLGLTEAMVSSTLWDPHIKDSRGWTVLHYAARYEDVRLACVLLVAGCDISAEDNNGQTFSNLMPRTSLQLLNKQLLRIDRRQIVCVIGHPKSGKSTLVAAFQQAPLGTLRKVSTFLQSDKIILTDTSRTAGINTATFSDDKLGNIIFFDFAGQSEYYASHLAFLESALASKGATITFMMVVDLRLSEEERFSQCMEWLFPIRSIVKEHNILNVVLIGSHQDQLKSGSSTAAVQSLYTTMQKLKTTLSTPYLQFVDCWGMDCRRLSSKGMARLQEYLKSRHSSYYNSDEGRHAPLGASLLFHKLKNLDNPPLAITPCMIIDKLKDGHHPFPLTVNYIDKCCQDLSAAGIVLYFLDREDASKSWLILEIEEILSRIHGKLFAPDHSDFPMHHKNLHCKDGAVLQCANYW